MDSSKDLDLRLKSMTFMQLKNTFVYSTDLEVRILYDMLNRGRKSVNEIANKYNYSVSQVYRIMKRMKKSIGIE